MNANKLNETIVWIVSATGRRKNLNKVLRIYVDSLIFVWGITEQKHELKIERPIALSPNADSVWLLIIEVKCTQLHRISEDILDLCSFFLSNKIIYCGKSELCYKLDSWHSTGSHFA